MPLQFNIGELSDRLRRSLGVRGKVDLGVDETVVPVVIVEDATRAPYRREGLRWFGRVQSPAAVGNLSRIRLGNGSPADMVLDWIIIAGALGCRFGTSVTPIAAIDTGPDFHSTELVDFQAVPGQPNSTLRGPSFFVENTAGSIITREFGYRASGVQSIQLALDIVLAKQTTFIFEGDVVNTTLDITFSGREFPTSQR